MSHTLHELHSEFSEDRALLHHLKLLNPHFHKIADRYHDVNRAVHRIESGVEAASDMRLEDLKKQRLALMDEIANMIHAHKAVA